MLSHRMGVCPQWTPLFVGEVFIRVSSNISGFKMQETSLGLHWEKIVESKDENSIMLD